MINKLTFSFFAFLLTLVCSAQSLNWGFPTANSGVNAIVRPSSSAQFSNGDILIAGLFTGSLQLKASTPSYSTSLHNRTGFFSRIDTNGTVLWTKILHGGNVHISDIEIGPSDSIYVTGSFNDSIDLDPSSNSSIITPPVITTQVTTKYPFLSKYDANGNFTKGSYVRFKSHALAGLTTFYPQIEIGSNSRLIFAFCPSPNGFVDIDLGSDSIWLDASSHAFQPLYIINYDLDFNYIWHKTIHGAYTSPVELCGLAVNSSNDIILTVRSAQSIEADPNHPGPEHTDRSALIGLSHTGDFKWINGIGQAEPQDLSNGQSKPLIIDPATDAIFVYAYAHQNGTDLDRSSNTYNIPFGHYIAKFDKNGHVAWAHNLGINSIGFPAMTMQEENIVIAGSFFGTVDFNFGLGDSTLISPNGNRRGFVARYDSDGQFLSVFTLMSSAISSFTQVATNPYSQSIIAFIGGNAGTIDLDPSSATQNVNIQTSSELTAIACYKLPCLPAKAFDRDTLPHHYDYCSNEYVDLQFPRRASGYSQTIWQMDTGNGFNAIDTSYLQYQIVGESIRFLTQNGMDTSYIRGIISNSCGIDTTETVSLFVRSADINTLLYHLCKNDSVEINGTKYFSPITFNDSLQNISGCDSIVVYDVQQLWPNASVSNNSGNLICYGGYDSYQWIRCSDMQPIVGATDSTFTPADSNEYAVIVSLNGCTDTSSCMRSSIGTNEFSVANINLYPNPSQGIIKINCKNISLPLRGRAYDINGKLLRSFKVSSKQEKIDLSNFSKGVYFIEITDTQGVSILKQKIILSN